MSANKIDLIRQALSAAESSIKLARQLLSEIESEKGKGRQRAKELPGLVGIFDGKDMTTEKGEKHPVPENYASKSILVVGDTLKLVEGGGEKRFKQIEHVKRHKTTGILAKKEGKWTAVTSEGSYRLLPAAVDHFGGDVSDEVLIQLPASNLQTTWAAVEKIMKKGPSQKGEDKKPPVAEEKVKIEKKEEEVRGKSEAKEDGKDKLPQKTEQPKEEKEPEKSKPEVKEDVKEPVAATTTEEELQ
ncbi:MAG: hypothetical protein WD187_00870 [Candidatus Woykebacteria bacterium]